MSSCPACPSSRPSRCADPRDRRCFRGPLPRGRGAGMMPAERPMRVLVANPNATRAITDTVAALARAAASPGTEVVAWTNEAGPPVVDSLSADYLAGAALVRGLLGVRPAPDAVVLAGFGNYGTGGVKEVLDLPVVSMAEAAMAVAGLLCHRFAIVTTAARMIPYTEDLVRLAGQETRCAGVAAVTLPPLNAAPPAPESVLAALAVEVLRAEQAFGADLVIRSRRWQSRGFSATGLPS